MPNPIRWPIQVPLLLVAGFTLAHIPVIVDWVQFVSESDLFSYTLLIPAVSGYLIYNRRTPWSPALEKKWVLSSGAWLAAAALWALSAGAPPQNEVSARMAAWAISVFGAVALTAQSETLLRHRFAFAFLLLAAPFPDWLEQAIENGLQHGSAAVVSGMLSATGMTFFRDGTVFQLPGITLEVAPECSGIHSTVVLFVVSLVAGQLFLKRTSHRLALTLFVAPLALLRNGFRVWVLANLCVYSDPSWIHSPLHHRGGPIFFALSLIPFSAMLLLLVRREKQKSLKATS
jgi:exosortase C (VPDSG-CTERM-specific)